MVHEMSDIVDMKMRPAARSTGAARMRLLRTVDPMGAEQWRGWIEMDTYRAVDDFAVRCNRLSSATHVVEDHLGAIVIGVTT